MSVASVFILKSDRYLHWYFIYWHQTISLATSGEKMIDNVFSYSQGSVAVTTNDSRNSQPMEMRHRLGLQKMLNYYKRSERSLC